MGLLEFGWINKNIGLHVPYGLYNVFGKPCSGFVLVSRHISVQVHISEILFSYHLACKFGMNFVLNPEPCILILFFLTDLDLQSFAWFWCLRCGNEQVLICGAGLALNMLIVDWPQSWQSTCTRNRSYVQRLTGPNMKPQHGIRAKSMPWVRHSAVGYNNIYEQEIMYWVKLGFK
jgi:hypothetical protein